jgi:hypothetical protein
VNERVEQVAGSLETHPAIVRLGAVVDLVGHLPQTPGVLVFEAAGGFDLPTGLARQRVACGGVEFGVQHQDQLIFAWCGQNGEGL